MSNYPDNFDGRAADASVDGGEPMISRRDVDDFVARAGEKFDALVAQLARDFENTDMAAVENWAPDKSSISMTRDNFMIDVRDALVRVIRAAGLEQRREPVKSLLNEQSIVRQAVEAALSKSQANRVNFPYDEWECPEHVGSENDKKVCIRCGCHIDSLRP